jgi:signal recognition particle receptor subunit beta
VGELTSIATEGDRTLFFDFLPLNLGQVAGMNTKFQIYTVPGQVYYNSTRKLVLQGADGIVFVADSRRGKLEENLESLQNLSDNLQEYGMNIKSTPLVLQYNKRDLPDVYSVEDLQEKLNKFNVPYFEAVAVTGEGVFPTLKKLSSMVLENLNRQQGSTAVRRPARQGEPVAVGAGSQRERIASRPVPPAQDRRGPEATLRQRTRSLPPADTEERSIEGQGIKPIRRRVPVAQSRRSDTRSVGMRSTTSIPRAMPKRRRRGPMVAIVVILLLIAGAAAVYLSGILRGFV